MYDLRSAFIPAPGKRMIVADYEALEMRILADQAGEADMIDIFLSGKDIHAGNGSLVFGFPYEDIMYAKDLDDAQWADLKSDPDRRTYLKSCKSARSDAKTVCFGLNYGMQAFNLSKKLKCSVPEAKAKMEQYLDRYPSVRNFFQDAVQIVLDTGFAFTYLGRRRTLTDIDADSKFLRNRAERQASNLPIQGCIPKSTRILTKHGMVPIGDAPENGVVWTGAKWAPYTKLNRGECELATIELANGQLLECDTRHSVLVLEDGAYLFKEWKELKEGDDVCISKAEPLEFSAPNPAIDAPIMTQPLHVRKKQVVWLFGVFGQGTSISLTCDINALRDIQTLLRTVGVESTVSQCDGRCTIDVDAAQLAHRVGFNPHKIDFAVPTVDNRPYATSKVVATKALGVVETTYTLSVDDPLHRFDSEGVISKNSAADVAKMAMIRCDQSQLNEYGWTMLSQVHDELIFEGPPETTREATQLVTECMEHPFDRDLKVPLKISIKDGNSWAEAK